MAVNTNQLLKNQVIYSIYVRNYSEEGSFSAVEKDLDRIQRLGTDIIWFLPVYPIGEKQRKGTLGSPYAISDYRKVNPELGTMEEFRHLVEAIHIRGMKCMLDIVYNHTSPDSWLVQNHPEFFYRTPSGDMGNRVGDWADIIDLDYGNQKLWAYQIETLKMWAQLVDGFRCDVASLVPLDFWLQARKEVSKVNPNCIWLSESVEPAFILDFRAKGITNLSDSEIYQAFDICYDYDIYELFREYLRGESPLSKYIEAVNRQEYIYPDNYVKLRYLENHDQDRAAKIITNELSLINWTVFIYFQKGTTLIYAGQENKNIERPDLFYKDVINLDGKRDMTALLSELYKIKKLPIMADSSYCLTAFDSLGAVVGEHRGIHSTDRLVGVFSFENMQGKIKVPLKDGMHRNLIKEQEMVKVENGMLDLMKCPVIIKG